MLPQSISHGSFLRIVTSQTRPVSAVQPKAPLLKGAGTAGEPPVAFAVTEGFYRRHFPKVRTYVERGRFFRE